MVTPRLELMPKDQLGRTLWVSLACDSRISTLPRFWKQIQAYCRQVLLGYLDWGSRLTGQFMVPTRINSFPSFIVSRKPTRVSQCRGLIFLAPDFTMPCPCQASPLCAYDLTGTPYLVTQETTTIVLSAEAMGRSLLLSCIFFLSRAASSILVYMWCFDAAVP